MLMTLSNTLWRNNSMVCLVYYFVGSGIESLWLVEQPYAATDE